MRRQDLQDGTLCAEQLKTGAKVRIDIVGPLEAVQAVSKRSSNSYPKFVPVFLQYRGATLKNSGQVFLRQIRA